MQGFFTSSLHLWSFKHFTKCLILHIIGNEQFPWPTYRRKKMQEQNWLFLSVPSCLWLFWPWTAFLPSIVVQIAMLTQSGPIMSKGILFLEPLQISKAKGFETRKLWTWPELSSRGIQRIFWGLQKSCMTIHSLLGPQNANFRLKTPNNFRLPKDVLKSYNKVSWCLGKFTQRYKKHHFQKSPPAPTCHQNGYSEAHTGGLGKPSGWSDYKSRMVENLQNGQPHHSPQCFNIPLNCKKTDCYWYFNRQLYFKKWKIKL